MEFTGEVTFVSTPPVAPSPGLFAVGDALAGSYTFDESTRIILGLPNTYAYSNSNHAFTLGSHSGSAGNSRSLYTQSWPFGSQSYFCAPGNVLCDAFPPPSLDSDVFRWSTAQEESFFLSGLGDYIAIDFLILLEDSTGTAIPHPSEAFLLDPPDLSAYDSSHFVVTFCAGNCPEDEFVVVGTMLYVR